VHDSRHLSSPEHLRALADPARVTILRRLMTEPATLTQLGRAMDKHAAWIRHHVLRLEHAGLIELAETRKIGGYTEKYYRAIAESFAVATMVLPDPGERGLVVVVGSDDPAVHLLADRIREAPDAPLLFTLATGSLEGLIALRQGVGDAAGCHLLDSETGEYNLPYARRLFPGRKLALVTLAEREQGLIVAPGNPGSLRSLDDLAASNLRFVNRNDGSGTRIWLDRQLADSGVSRETLTGYENVVSTHDEVARAIAGGSADAGIGVRAAARARGLDFVPLFEERYDLVVPWERHETSGVQAVLARLRDGDFQRAVRRLGGYRTDHTGDERVVA
jgi:molybdate-binding protein